MNGVTLVSEIIEILVAGFQGVATGVGTGISELAQGIFFSTVEGATGLSVFGTLIVVFSAVSLALSLCRWVLNFITSFGNRNR